MTKKLIIEFLLIQEPEFPAQVCVAAEQIKVRYSGKFVSRAGYSEAWK